MELKLDNSRIYAIALEGGGARGAYQVGAWKALEEAGIRYQAVSGTSVGALNGAFMAMRDLPQAEEVWREIKFSQVMDVDDQIMERILNVDFHTLEEVRSALKTIRSVVREGGFDPEPLKQMLAQRVDGDRIRNSGVEFYLTTYSLTDMEPLELNARDLSDEQLRDMLMASANFPAFKQERISGKHYADGGLHDVVPISGLIARGCKDIIVLRLYGLGIEKRVKIPDDVTVTTIAPEESLGNMLNFSSRQSNLNLTQGYYDAKRVLYGLYGKSYYLERTMTEEDAYEALSRLVRNKHSDATLRDLNETYLADLGSHLRCRGDYYDLLIALEEYAAEALTVFPYQIRTERNLMEEIKQQMPALSPKKKDRILSYLQ